MSANIMQGIPLNTGSERFADLGYQYKRAAAIAGDIFYHAPRLHDARQYAKFGGPTYIYRFNTRAYRTNVTATSYSATDALAPAAKGVAHFSEVAFVFGSPGVGSDPQYKALSDQMSALWISFVYDGDPNSAGLPEWPTYDQGVNGLNLVLQTQEQGGSYVEEDTYRLAGREFLTKWAPRRHV
jgi:carboxylesterase type B